MKEIEEADNKKLEKKEEKKVRKLYLALKPEPKPEPEPEPEREITRIRMITGTRRIGEIYYSTIQPFLSDEDARFFSNLNECNSFTELVKGGLSTFLNKKNYTDHDIERVTKMLLLEFNLNLSPKERRIFASIYSAKEDAKGTYSIADRIFSTVRYKDANDLINYYEGLLNIYLKFVISWGRK